MPRQDQERIADNVQGVGALGKELGVAEDTVQTLVDFAVALGVDDHSGVSLENQDACRNVLLSRYGEDEGGKIVADARRRATGNLAAHKPPGYTALDHG